MSAFTHTVDMALILKEIGRGERIALSKLAIEHLERDNRPLRVAIDAAIWNFQSRSGQGGSNPALRTLFFRFLRLLALPIQPVFVYDGKNKPLTKRGRTVTEYGGTCVESELSKDLVKMFGWPSHVAPGEAEAECAFLQTRGVVDMVMSQDVDAIMFGSGVTLRDWSKEGTRGNKSPTHVNMLESHRIKEISGLDTDGMILVALLSGGDYDESGVPGFGAALACEVARAGFGKDLIDLVGRKDWQGLREWRERLQYELETNESGYFKRRHKTLQVPDTFPDLKILGYYIEPAVSTDEDLPSLEASWCDIWKAEIDVPALREYTASMFDWSWRSGARRFVRCFAQPLFQDRLRRGTVVSAPFSVGSISERRQHFINDGIPELRLSAIPAEVVGIDIQAEEENPDYALDQIEEDNERLLGIEDQGPAEDEIEEPQSVVPSSPSKRRRPPPWDPNVLERWWIPETLLQIGLPEIREEWHQLQRDIQADPKKFASRKAARLVKTSRKIDNNMHVGAIRGFFTTVYKTTADAGTTSIKDVWSESDDLRPHKAHNVTMPKKPQVKAGCSTSLNSVSHSRKPQNRSRMRDSNEIITRVAEVTRSNLLANSTQLISKPTNNILEHENNQQDGRRADSDLAEDILAKNTFCAAIEIDSSPPGASSTVPQVTVRDEHTDRTTHRKPRRPRTRQGTVPSSTPDRRSRVRRPIESFFQSSQENVTAGSPKGKTATETTSAATLRPVPTMVAAQKASKKTVVARDSLPGTWETLDADAPSQTRASRVSYVDLTSD